MTIEPWILAACALLCLALPMVYVPLHARQAGPAAIGAAGRGARAHRNLLENLLPFAIAILAARSIGVSDTLTLAGAWLFLVARVVHAVAYTAGITGVRTLAYVAGLVGTVLIFTQLH